ncbi:MAG: hypothetical protein AAB290_02135, partial [Candidatus Eisenbacteria bacterium]
HGVTLVMATHDVNVVNAMADVVYVLVGGGEIVAHGSPEQIFRDPAVLRNSNIEPPVLAELFERLEEMGLSLGRPLSVSEAAKAIVEWGERPAHSSRPAPPAPASKPAPGATRVTVAPRPVAGAPAPPPAPAATPELPFLFDDDEKGDGERPREQTRERSGPRSVSGETP